MLCRRVNGKAVREGGYEVQASFGPLAATHCCVLGGDVGAVVCGGATDFHVAPHDADVTGRKVPHQDALSVTVTGAIFIAVLTTMCAENMSALADVCFMKDRVRTALGCMTCYLYAAPLAAGIVGPHPSGLLVPS